MNKYVIILFQVLVFVFVLFLWETLAYYHIIDEFLFSKPSKVYKLFLIYLENNMILNHVFITLYEMLMGLFLGSLIGFIIASILWFYPLLSRILMPFMFVLNALPKTALAPIFIIWIGMNTKGVIFVGIFISLVITILSLLNHFNNIDQNLVKMLKSFNAKKIHIYKYIVLPSNLLNMISILKINVGLSFIGVIAGEFIVSREGIGYLIMYGSQIFRLDLVMLGVFLLAIVSVLVDILMNLLINLLKRKGIFK